MENSVFLKDVLDTSHFCKEAMNVIYAPCGSGKTTAAIDKILPLASDKTRVIYLIDTQLGNERLATQYKDVLEKPNPFYEEIIAYSRPHWGIDRVCITTYAKFGVWCKKHPHFEEYFEYILCDEPQNLVNFSEIGKWTADEVDVNVHKIARNAICNAVNHGNVMVVGITATPKPLEKLNCELHEVPIDRTNLHHYTENNTILYSKLNSVLDKIKPGMRGGIYMKHVKPMRALGEELRKRGFNPLMLWSLSNEEFPLTAEQLDARKYIIENEAIPEEYDIFLFNATAETSINLNDKVDFFIAHNTNSTSVTQSRGRYRSNIDTLFKEDVKGFEPIPDSYLGRPLNRTELKELRDFLGIKKETKRRHDISIDDMLVEFSNHGYNVEQKKRNRRDSFIIQKV